MATSETILSQHTATVEQVDKNEEEKSIEQESVSPSKKGAKEHDLRVEKLLSPAASLPKIKEKTEDKQIEPTLVEGVVEIDDAPAVVPVEEKLEGEQDPIHESHESAVSEPVVDVIKGQPEEQEAIESVEEEAQEQPTTKPVEKQPEKQRVEPNPTCEPDTFAVSEPLVDAIKGRPVEQEAIESVEKELQHQPVVQPVEKEPEKQQMEQDPIYEPDASSFSEPLVDAIRGQPEEEQVVESVGKEPQELPLVQLVEKHPENQQVEEDPIHETDTSTVSEPVVDAIKGQPQAQEAIEIVEKEPQELAAVELVGKEPEEQQVEHDPLCEPHTYAVSEPAVETVQKQQGEQQEIVDVSESSADVSEKSEEALEVSPVNEPEAPVVKETEDSTVESIIVEEPESEVPVADEKPREQSEVTEQVEEKLEVKPKESVAGEMAKVKETLTDKVEDTKILKEELISKEQELFASNSSDEAVSINQEAQADSKGDEGDTLPDVVEKTAVKNMEDTIGASVVEGLSREAAVELGKVEGENEEKNVMTEVLTQPTKVEDVNSSISTEEVIEKTFEGENTSRDFEQVVDDKREEDTKDEKVASVEAGKDGDVEKKLDGVITSVTEPVSDDQESELGVKGQETVEADVNNLEKEKVDQIVKSEGQSLNPSSKFGDDTKTSQDLPKEVPAKPVHKQSNNIITKVKQSLVKAKKAIIGKSPNSKALSSETKGDVKVK